MVRLWPLATIRIISRISNDEQWAFPAGGNPKPAYHYKLRLVRHMCQSVSAIMQSMSRGPAVSKSRSRKRWNMHMKRPFSGGSVSRLWKRKFSRAIYLESRSNVNRAFSFNLCFMEGYVGDCVDLLWNPKHARFALDKAGKEMSIVWFRVLWARCSMADEGSTPW